MKTRVLVCGLSCAFCTALAQAHRPFDGTDADVLDQGDAEIELGYLHLLWEGKQKFLEAPVAVLNFGLTSRSELVFEGRFQTHLNGPDVQRRGRFEDAGIFVKHLHRLGSLQDATGPSIASECGLLLPTNSSERVGAGCNAIVSQQGPSGIVHFNASLTKSREGNWERMAGVIMEGVGAIRPAAELVVARDSAGQLTKSALVAVKWTVRENLTFDVGLRKARADHQAVSEVRLGLTWAVPKG